MKKITISAFAFIVGTSVGVWLIIGSGFVSSNSDFICKSENVGTSTSECTGGSWTTWNLDTHTQIYRGFIYTTSITRNWYDNTSGSGRWHQGKDYACGERGIKDVGTIISSTPCTMTRLDPNAPNTKVSTENIPATCENCLNE